jgi:hypothetical protein
LVGACADITESLCGDAKVAAAFNPVGAKVGGVSAGNVALANDYGSPFATSALPHALYGVYLPLVVR